MRELINNQIIQLRLPLFFKRIAGDILQLYLSNQRADLLMPSAFQPINSYLACMTLTPSIWEKESFFAPKDLIIIGSGFVGLWTAYWYKKKHPKRSVTILERGIIPTGASTRNAGFACFGSITELLEDAQTMGIDKTLELVEMRFRGLEQIQSLFSRKKIGFELTGGYDLLDASFKTPINQFREQMEWMNASLKKQLGKKSVFSLADDRIRRFGLQQVSHIVENRFEGYLHSGKLSQLLLSKVQGLGVEVLNGIDVRHVEETASEVILQTDRGMELRASKILACTNAFVTSLFPELQVVPARGQVLLTSPIKGLKLKGCFHYDQGYYYFRNLGNRVLLGGARNKAFQQEQTTEFNITETIQSELERFLSGVILPGKAYTITDRWSGIMGMGPEKMPLINQLSNHMYCAVRMSGMGVALAPVVGKMVIDRFKL